MPGKHVLSVATAVMLALLVALAPWPAIADMPVTFLPVEPVAGASFGWGYNLTTKQFTSPCVIFNKNALYQSGDPDQGSAFELTETTSTIASKSNLSISASLSVLAGDTNIKLNDKADVAGGTESSTYSQTLFASAYRYNVPDFLDIAQVSFIPATRQLLTDKTSGGKGQFQQQCGDAFVIGIQKGREFVGTASVMQQSLKSFMNFANSAGASASGLWGSASGNVNIANAMEQSFGSTNIKVKTYSTGSNQPNPAKATELQTYYQKFLNSTGSEKTIHLILASYRSLQDYPWENPLQGNTKDDYMAMMLVALWDLKAAIRDANFLLDPTTQNMFAMWPPHKKGKVRRLDYIKLLRDTFQKEYDMLLKAAKKCDQNFTSACQSLAEFYDHDRNLHAQWIPQLPERYLSDCYQPLVLKNVGDTLTSLLSAQNFGTPVYGDAATGGSPFRVVAELTFAPDKSQLKANLSVMKMEERGNYTPFAPIPDHAGGPAYNYSTWGMQTQAVVFDLDAPQNYGLGSMNLNNCTWKDKGVQLPDIPTPTAFAPLTSFGFSQQVTHGIIDNISGSNPQGRVHYGNGKGALDFIRCDVTGPPGQNNDNNTHCWELGVRNVPLNLVSLQDLKADKWMAGPDPQVPAALTNFDRGTAITAAQTGQFKPLSQSLSPAQKNIVNAIALRRSEATAKFKARVYKLPNSQANLIQTHEKRLPSKPNPESIPQKN